MDFIYLYRPLRPTGPGEEFYRSFAAQLGASRKPVVIFSIADCLRPYLSSDFEVFYSRWAPHLLPAQRSPGEVESDMNVLLIDLSPFTEAVTPVSLGHIGAALADWRPRV